MPRTSVLLALAALVAICACSCSSKRKPPPSGNATPTNAARPTASGTNGRPAGATPTPDPTLQAQLATALLLLSDLPAGWSAAPATTSGSDATPLDFCGVAGVEGQELARAEESFQRSALGPYFTEEIMQLPPGVARTQLNALAKALPTCRPQTISQQGGLALTYTTTPLAFPLLGEQTVAAHLAVDGSLLPIVGNAIFVRRANSVLVIALLAVGRDGPDASLTEALARAADARFATVAR